MRTIGIIQGRLLPPIDGKIQAFPWDDWRGEFDLARDLELGSIEFIFEGPGLDCHPLLDAGGREEVRSAVRTTGVRVGSICADHFMDHPLHGVPDAEAAGSLAVLERLTRGAADLGIPIIEIPCVDHSSLRSASDQDALVERLTSLVPAASEMGIKLSLETDLPPLPFRRLLDRFDGAVGANYDTGNSASLGYDPRAEIRTLAELIVNVHIKDRVLAGGTVPLGEGDTRLEDCFLTLAEIGYSGEFILQVARGKDDVDAARRYRAQVAEWIHRFFDGG
jgi:L-ribulose-5-phosphate 3-epimerase